MNDSIIFDLDGTLWNASTQSAKGFNNGLEELGVKKRVTIEEIERITGKPYTEWVKILFPDLAHTTLFEVLDKNERKILEKEGGLLYNGVVDGITRLAKTFPIFIISNCTKWYLETFLKFSGLKKQIKDFDCYEMSAVHKSEMIANMKKRHFLNNPVYIGDTASDQEATELAKVEFIYVSYGFGEVKKQCLSFSNFSDLVKYFENQC